MRFIPKFRVISRKSHVYSRKSFFYPLKWAPWAAVISICRFNFYNFFKIFKFKWKRLATFVFNSIAIYLSICGAPVIGKPNERERECFNFVLDWVIWWMKKKKNRYVIHWLYEQTVINHHVICQWQKPWSVYVHRVWNLYQIPKKQFSHNSTNAGIKDQARAITTSCTVSTMTAALIRVQLIKNSPDWSKTGTLDRLVDSHNVDLR